MDARLPILVQDRMTSARKGIEAFERFHVKSESILLDGPISERVAILDFDENGALIEGARYLPPTSKDKEGYYDVSDTDITRRDTNQVSVFAAIMKTISLFEDKYALGRRINWAFNAPQLLVVPRAGRWANAFYERNSHSLQFFYFENPNNAGDMVYTSLSLDIVAHETAHAILDGIVPSLYDSITPQALALHEAIADLVAVLVSLYSGTLVNAVLAQTGGSIQYSTAFSSLAEEFGGALDVNGRVGYLRNLLNNKNLDPDDKVDGVKRSEPHELSQVLSGALYKLLLKLHEDLKKKYRNDGIYDSEYSVSGKALAVSRDRFRSILLRALDYIPTGDTTFADYGRAIIAADQAAYPDHSDVRDYIRNEFVNRHIVLNREALEVETNYSHTALKGINLEDLCESDSIAYQFAEKNRDFLSIPMDATIKVEPRLKVWKTYRHTKREVETPELLYKVNWTHIENNSLKDQFPKKRRVKFGTTLVIDWETNKVRALLTSGQNTSNEECMEQKNDRDLFLRNLVKSGYLVPEKEAIGPDGKKLENVFAATDVNGAMRINNIARMLHIINVR